MHRLTIDRTTSCDHNGDFSGDVILNLPESAVEFETVNGSNRKAAVTISFFALATIVAKAVRNNKIEKIENMDIADLLGLDRNIF